MLNEQETKRLLRAARTVRDKALLEFLYASGRRLAETVSIGIEDIDFQQRKVRVRAKRKERIVYLGASAARALRQYIKTRKTGPLFLDDHVEQKGLLEALKCTASGWEVHWRQYPQGERRFIRIGTPPQMHNEKH